MKSARPAIEVAAGVVRDESRGRVLIAKRPETVHQGGLWEFPGGKLERGETIADALQRELWEELGITVHASTPLITLKHDYPDRTIRLHVREVRDFSGEPLGKEGQPIRWVTPDELDQYAFPEANHPIRTAVKLPECYPILNLDDHSTQTLDAILSVWSDEGHKLIRFRTSQAARSSDDLTGWIAKARALGISVLIDGSEPLMRATGAAGLHLTSQALSAVTHRPVAKDRWLAASCHDALELAKAAEVGVDFVVLGPVLPTASHPGAPAMGWSALAALVAPASFPVYALGGTTPKDVRIAREHGAQGIAAIRAFLGNPHGLGA